MEVYTYGQTLHENWNKRRSIRIRYRILKGTLPADIRDRGDNRGQLWKKIETQLSIIYPCILPQTLSPSGKVQVVIL